MTKARRKPIMCWPKTVTKVGVESTSRGDARKDWQRMVGGKAGVEEIGGSLITGGESLNEILRAAPTQRAKQPTNQTNKTGNKQRWGKG
jgi:hypothetical protein